MLLIPVIVCAAAPKPLALHHDIENGSIEELRKHLDQGANLTERDRTGKTPLHLALKLQKPEMALELIARGADINARMPDGSTPLILATEAGFADVTNLLLERKAVIDVLSARSSPLFGAVRANNRELFERLVLAGAQIDRRDSLGVSPLYVAAESGHLSLVKRLLELGADINAAMPDQRTPIYGAIGEEKTEVAEVLYARGATINAASGEMGTFLTPLVYRFAARQEYQMHRASRSSEYLQRAAQAFVSAQRVLNERADEFSHAVTRQRQLNVLSLIVGQASANIQASTSLSGTGSQTAFLPGTSGREALRDKYRSLARYCELEAKRMPAVQSCVESDASASRDCFATPPK